MTQFVFENFANTTLADAASSTATTLTLSSASGLPSSLASGQQIPLVLNNASNGVVFEICYITAVNGSSVTVLRAQEGTSAQQWNAGDYAYVAMTAGTTATIIATHSPTASETLPVANQLVVTPGTLLAAIDLTLNDTAVAGSDVTIYGSAADYAVTVQSPVTAGSPYIQLPDGSQVYSWTIPAASPSQGIRVVWDGTNWIAQTFGQTVVALANKKNQAMQLGQRHYVTLEQFGGVPNDSAFDNTAAWNAAIADPSLFVRLGANDYWFASTPILDAPNVLVKGAGCEYTGAGTATRIIINSSSLNGLQVGPSTAPTGGINSYPQGIRIEDFEVTRGVAPEISSNCIGVLTQYVLTGHAYNVKSTESMIGFEDTNVVDRRHFNCRGFRSVAGSGTGTDYFTAFHATGNSSFYNYNPNATAGGFVPAGQLIGFLFDGNINDNTLLTPETSQMGIGVQINGTSGSTSFGTSEDLHIINPILDQFYVAGILIQNLPEYGCVDVIGGYAAPNASDTGLVACVYLDGCTGPILVSSMQFILQDAQCRGWYALNSSNFVFEGNRHVEGGMMQISVSGCSNYRVRDISTTYYAADTSNAVAEIGTSNYGDWQLVANGGAGYRDFVFQVLDSTSTGNVFNLAGANPSLPAGGAANIISVNGVNSLGNGYINGNYVTGSTFRNPAPVYTNGAGSSAPAASTNYTYTATIVAPVDGTVIANAILNQEGSTTGSIEIQVGSNTQGPSANGTGSAALCADLHVVAGSSTTVTSTANAGTTAGTNLGVDLQIAFIPD